MAASPFGLKKAIDLGMIAGPRIWPSGAMMSQSGGHGDFRLPTDLPASPESFAYSERIGATEIADDPGTVRRRVREQLALGASQIKLMAGGGVASSYDPQSCMLPSKLRKIGAPTSRCMPTLLAQYSKPSQPA